MSVNDDLHAAASHVAGLRRSVTGLSRELGNTVDVQRLRDDVVRLANDVDLLARSAGVGTHDRAGAPGEIVFIPDDDYDPSMWADVEDEGVGSHRGTGDA
jgi:hypothetical protein